MRPVSSPANTNDIVTSTQYVAQGVSQAADKRTATTSAELFFCFTQTDAEIVAATRGVAVDRRQLLVETSREQRTVKKFVLDQSHFPTTASLSSSILLSSRLVWLW